MNQASADRDFQIFREKILETIQTFPIPEGFESQIAFQMILASSLLDLAATFAVDAGLSKTAWDQITTETFDRAFERAPKFGD